MPTPIRSSKDLRPGEIYEDPFFHPCLCTSVGDDGEVNGISLVDGSFPRGCDAAYDGLRKLSPSEAWRWRTSGPEELPDGVDLSSLPNWWVVSAS